MVCESAVVEEMGLLAAETWEEDAAVVASWIGDEALAMGSFFLVVVGEGVSTNMMEGPAPSSVATAERGTGLEVNLGREPWFMEGVFTADIACEELESWEEELAMLCVFFVLLAPDTTVSEAVVLG